MSATINSGMVTIYHRTIQFTTELYDLLQNYTIYYRTIQFTTELYDLLQNDLFLHMIPACVHMIPAAFPHMIPAAMKICAGYVASRVGWNWASLGGLGDKNKFWHTLCWGRQGRGWLAENSNNSCLVCFFVHIIT